MIAIHLKHTVQYVSLLMLCLGFASTAFAASNDPVVLPKKESQSPSLVILPGHPCGQRYLAELKAVGIQADVSPVSDLRPTARFVGLPSSKRPQHILFIGGYVFAGHVPAGAVADTLARRPTISGLVGTMDCNTPDHSKFDTLAPTPFQN